MSVTLIRPHTCSTCAFKEREGNGLRCHRNAPQAFPIFAGGPGGQVQVVGDVSLWPFVREDQWCGEYCAFSGARGIMDGEALRTQ